jgi:sugar/nucleoside kinase (ribokinase family)
VLDQCPGAAVTALDSFMLWIETEFETLSEALRKVDVAILNEEEVCSIAGDGILSRAVDMVRSGVALYGGEAAGPGPRSLIVKRGSSGSVAYLPCGTITLPAYPTDDLVDPTGCGDSFAGALLANIAGRKGALNQLDTMRNALLHATVTASFTIEGLGASGLYALERGKYHARADKYRRMVGL